MIFFWLCAFSFAFAKRTAKEMRSPFRDCSGEYRIGPAGRRIERSFRFWDLQNVESQWWLRARGVGRPLDRPTASSLRLSRFSCLLLRFQTSCGWWKFTTSWVSPRIFFASGSSSFPQFPFASWGESLERVAHLFLTTYPAGIRLMNGTQELVDCHQAPRNDNSDGEKRQERNEKLMKNCDRQYLMASSDHKFDYHFILFYRFDSGAYRVRYEHGPKSDHSKRCVAYCFSSIRIV